MSNSDHTPGQPPGPPPQDPSQRSGCLTALMVIFGIIMLLPGLCALLFGGMSLSEGGRIESDVGSLIFLGLAIGAAGVGLIWSAIRRRRT